MSHMSASYQPMDLDVIGCELKDFEESLFRIEDEHLHKVERFMLESDIIGDDRDEVDVYRVAARLMCGEISSLPDMIEDGVNREPESIHAWCNKGVYHVMKGERELASAALTRVKELRKMTVPLIIAKRDSAFWIAERGRQNHHYLKALAMFDDMMTYERNLHNESLKPLVDKAAELYVITLVRFCRKGSVRKEEEPQWFADKLHIIIDLLARIWNTNEEDKRMFVFSWVVEVFTNGQFHNTIACEMKRLSIAIGIPSITLERCLEGMEEYAIRTKNAKILARVGKSWYYSANLLGEQSKSACLKAITLCEMSLSIQEDVYIASDIISKAHMWLWVLEYYSLHSSIVHSEYEDVMGATYGKPLWQVQKFLYSGLFFLKIDESEGKDHVVKAHDTLQRLLEVHSKGMHMAVELARMKYLLGKPNSEVANTFIMALNSHQFIEESGHSNTHLKYARFLEKTMNPNEAKNHYKEALKMAHSMGKNLREAENRLLFL